MDYLGVNLPPSQSTSHIQQISLLTSYFSLVIDRWSASPLTASKDLRGRGRVEGAFHDDWVSGNCSLPVVALQFLLLFLVSPEFRWRKGAWGAGGWFGIAIKSCDSRLRTLSVAIEKLWVGERKPWLLRMRQWHVDYYFIGEIALLCLGRFVYSLCSECE